MRQCLDGDLQPPLTGTLLVPHTPRPIIIMMASGSWFRLGRQVRRPAGAPGSPSSPGSQPSLSRALLHGPQDAMKSESSAPAARKQVQGQHMTDADSEGGGVAPAGHCQCIELGPTRPESRWLLTVAPSLCARPGPAGRSVPGRKFKIEKPWPGLDTAMEM
jgi:hypothetical protein